MAKVLFKVFGDCLRFDKNPKIPNIRNMSSGRKPQNDKPPAENDKVYSNFMKSKVRQIKSFLSIKSVPTTFISLSVHRTVCKFESVTEEKKYFNRFIRKVTRHYPKSWFWYKFEWGHITKLHVHLIGSLGCGIDNDSCHAKKLRKLWNDANDGVLDRASYHQMDFTKLATFGYLMRPSKNKLDIICMKIFEGKRRYGYINRKNIKFYPPVTFSLTTEEFFCFQIQCEEYFRKETTSKYYLKAFKRERTIISFIPRKVILKFIENAKDPEYGVEII